MPLPKNPAERKKAVEAVTALSKLPPERRKAVMRKVMERRGLDVPAQLKVK